MKTSSGLGNHLILARKNKWVAPIAIAKLN